MKRCFWMLLAALFCLPALRAQNLVIGARVADLKVSEYVVVAATGRQPAGIGRIFSFGQRAQPETYSGTR
ncbi:MAG: hypothetical protein ACLR8Y_01070 [Alistipes indistinctus]